MGLMGYPNITLVKFGNLVPPKTAYCTFLKYPICQGYWTKSGKALQTKVHKIFPYIFNFSFKTERYWSNSRLFCRHFTKHVL